MQEARADRFLQVEGSLALLSAGPLIAIVGTREPQDARKRAAVATISEALAHAGAVIVSGGALGVDMIAHHAALQAGGVTVAVPPSALDALEEDWRPALREGVRAGRALLLAPFAPGTRTTVSTPVRRNHLVGALSEAVVAGEFGPKSGTRYVVSMALQTRRPLFLLRSGAEDEATRGMQRELLRQGATAVDPGFDAVELAAAICRAAEGWRVRRAREAAAQTDLFAGDEG